MTPEQAQTIIDGIGTLKTGVTELTTKMEMLITNGGSKGLVPELRADVKKHAAQIAFWRGAIAVLGFLFITLATLFAGHVAFGH